jgi:hypothetical protein
MTRIEILNVVAWAAIIAVTLVIIGGTFGE